MKRKILATILTLGLGLSLASCVGSNPEDQKPTDNPNHQETPENPEILTPENPGTTTPENPGTVIPEKTLESIHVSGGKEEFKVGDTFDKGNLKVTAKYSDNTEEDVTSKATISTPDMSKIGTPEVIISYNGKEASYRIKITAKDTPITPPNTEGDVGTQGEVNIIESAGYMEGAYVEWEPVQDATFYHVYYKKQGESDITYKKIDDMLVRKYANYYRADVLGLAAGSYELKVVPVVNEEEKSFYSTVKMNVIAHDRSGFAFSSESKHQTGSGAYNEDGTLRKEAQVVYITSSNAKTVEATIGGNKVNGFQSILAAKQKKGNTDVLNIRIVGEIKRTDLDDYLSKEEGIQIKGAEAYQNMNLTIEGVGEDATINGFGFLIRSCGNVEMRNLGIINFMDDGVSVDTDNCNLWLHNLDFFYGNPGGDSDQAKGDGSLDIKKSQYITVSYNHFWDSGKSCLVDASAGTSTKDADYLTYHHNWFDHSDSRHPRVRHANVHIYNNYFDGNSKYGIGASVGGSIFAEANYFRNVKYPMLTSMQGNDVGSGDGKNKGTFSGENGGFIKAFGNFIDGGKFTPYNNKSNPVEFDAYVAQAKDEIVPESITSKQGNQKYSNFDTASTMYTYHVDNASDVPTIVKAYAGRLNGGDLKYTFDNSVQDSNYGIIPELKSLVTSYKTTLIKVLGDTTASSSDEEEIDDDNKEPSNPTITDSVVHNFTEDGTTSTVFTINGNLSTGKGSQTYNGLTLTQCLKLESATTISFSIEEEMTLVIVLGNSGTYAGQTIKVDDTKYTSDANGVVTITLTAGSHTLSKADTSNIFLLMLSK